MIAEDGQKMQKGNTVSPDPAFEASELARLILTDVGLLEHDWKLEIFLYSREEHGYVRLPVDLTNRVTCQASKEGKAVLKMAVN